jgi:hypothetical protein
LEANFLVIDYVTSSSPYTLEEAQARLPGWEKNLRGDPLFTNAGAFDFSLQTGSPAIDAGRPIAGVSFRGAAPDLGAVER